MTELKTCPTLSGRSTLKYEIGTVDDAMSIRIVENSSGGLFSKDWIPLAKIESILEKAGSPFSSVALHDLCRGKSINMAGFILAVLLNEGLIQPVQGKRKGYEVRKSMKVEA